MRVHTVSDAVYYLLGRLPLLAVMIGVVWVLATGAAELERISFGSEFFVSNDATSNLPAGTGPSDEEILMDALNSGDTAQMSAALDKVDQRNAALATR